MQIRPAMMFKLLRHAVLEHGACALALFKSDFECSGQQMACKTQSQVQNTGGAGICKTCCIPVGCLSKETQAATSAHKLPQECKAQVRS